MEKIPEPKFYIKGVPFCWGGPGRKQSNEYATNFKFRPDDILVVGYPRSGTTFRRQIIWLVANGADVTAAKTEKLIDRMPNLDEPVETGGMTAEQRLGKMTPTAPRMIFSHMPYSMCKENVEAAGIKVIYLVRNPKDVLVSLFHAAKYFLPILGKEFANASFEQVMTYMLSNKCDRGNILDHVNDYWQQRDNPNFHFIFFEDTRRDCAGTIQKLAKFLDKEISPDQEAAIMDFVSFESFQKHMNAEESKDRNFDASQQHNFVRKGQVGDWKNHFTVAQNEYYDRLTSKKIKEMAIPYTFE